MLAQLGKRVRTLAGQEERQRNEPPKISTPNDLRTVLQILQQNYSLLSVNVHPEYTEFLHSVASQKDSSLLAMARHIKIFYSDTYFMNSPYIHPGALSMDKEFDQVVELWNWLVEKIAAKLNWKFATE